MAYEHGVRISEQATSLLPTVKVSAGIPVIIGTAAVNMADPENVNKPKLCYSYAEAVEAFGHVPAELDPESGLKKFRFSISELIQSAFSLYGVCPIIAINVLDPAKHKCTVSATSVRLDPKTGQGVVEETGILSVGLTLSSESGEYSVNDDFVLSFDDDGFLVITSLKNEDGDFKCQTGTDITLSAEKLDPSKVTEEDIIGGVDTEGRKRGLELISDIFPLFRLVPGTIIAPGYSENPGVAAVMAAKCASVNSVFKSVCVVDVPTDTVKQYTEVAAWKNDNNIVDPLQIACWPEIRLDETIYRMSSQIACLMAQVDSENDDVPYVSPSNHNLQMTGTVLKDGTEVVLGQDNGAYLNGEGVVTALNFIGGWVAWGNRTAAYPGSTDVKDTFIPVRRMFNWIGNTFVQTFWPRIDGPLNRRQVHTIVDSANIWLNGLSAQQYILGGRIEFLEDENTTLDLMDGKVVFDVSVTPPSPNRAINFKFKYDVQYLQTLFQ